MAPRWPLVIVACLVCLSAPTRSGAAPYDTSNLPAPFDSWEVEVKPDPMQPDDPAHQVILEFDEFLNVLGARRDGRDMILAGTGSVKVTSPPAFVPGKSYELVITPGGGTPVQRTLAAGADGRLTYGVTLGAVRSYDEIRLLVDIGLFALPDTRVEILDSGSP